MGLLEALKQYASDAAGGSLNPEVGNTLSGLLSYGKDRARYIGGLLDDSSPINKDFKNWHDRTQLGLADLIAGKEGPQADYGYSQIMNMAGVAPLGITAWHGSPHKFDKFSLDKIGTGEGAQAYGHGLYLAESPEVAQSYQSTVRNISGQNDRHLYAFGKSNKWDIQKTKEDIERAIGFVKDDLKANPADASAKDALNQYTDLLSNLSNESLLKVKGDGQLYKTDIPDEAVARFLDWDKPLSQQAPEVQQFFSAHGFDVGGGLTSEQLHAAAKKYLGSKQAVKMANEDIYFARDLSAARKAWNKGATDLEDYMSTGDGSWLRGILTRGKDGNKLGGSAYKELADKLGGFGQANYQGGGQMAASDALRTGGASLLGMSDGLRGFPSGGASNTIPQIPGIRYFDGASRAAGQGSSNFVAFDPEMIRILERNGQPTGLEPWKPGEYRLGDLLK